MSGLKNAAGGTGHRWRQADDAGDALMGSIAVTYQGPA
jgi:hypothetical protein